MNSKKQKEAPAATAQPESKPMIIDYFEFIVLVEAAWSNGTILKNSILVKACDTWYHSLSKNDRLRAFEFFKRLDAKDDIHFRLMKRFNPSNQFKVHLENNGDEQSPECYYYEGKYWTSSFQFANSDFILSAKQI